MRYGLLAVCVCMIGSAMAQDKLAMSSGKVYECKVLKFKDGIFEIRMANGQTVQAPAKNVTAILFGGGSAGAGTAAVPEKPAEPPKTRIITAGDLNNKQKDMAYFVFSYPYQTDEEPVWIIIEQKGHGEYKETFKTVFDRSGQMYFEVPKGEYRVTVYADAQLRKRISSRKTYKMSNGQVQQEAFR